ncbi:hypothetical protein BV22DRAFT_1142458 [Leucogyrophana mollusca]|uniref:Uncharacterized protein n=1 Tax=Leucogyrophana mollusca TaxID=85980 RepID=A0ACB8BVX9_9AGAM|nr:hypothetical protein BV22DRAFT_1142458 [Leucogyrophana mollusca]
MHQEGHEISITAHNHETCPLKALEVHCFVNAGPLSTTPLFTYRTADGWLPPASPPSRTTRNEIWTAASFSSPPGHAFRIGGATGLLLRGVNPDVVSQRGQWKSQAFLEYWRRIKSILLFLSLSRTQPLVASILRLP